MAHDVGIATGVVPGRDTTDGVAALAKQIPVDRFEVIANPLGWRCRSCRAEVSAPTDPELSFDAAVARLAESAADHAMYCGRCDD